MINGVILKKLETLDEVLCELDSLGQVTVKQLQTYWVTRRAIERDLQIMVEIVIDVCQRIISLSGQSPPSSGAEAVTRCVALGALSSEEPYRRMVQFRNFIVHRYEQVDVEILVTLVNKRLDDFRRFRTEILKYAQH